MIVWTVWDMIALWLIAIAAIILMVLFLAAKLHEWWDKRD